MIRVEDRRGRFPGGAQDTYRSPVGAEDTMIYQNKVTRHLQLKINATQDRDQRKNNRQMH
jgi:hypothetical protein